MTLTALVTGANRGIGKAIAEGLLQQDMHVVIGARDPLSGQQAAAELGCDHVELNLRNHEEFADIIASVGQVDVLINNAGVLYEGSMLDHPEDFQDSLETMVHGPYHLIRACVPHMQDRNYGRIVNLSSGWGAFSEGLQGPGAYGVAKAALNALTLALSHELPSTIKINAMCPGWVHTRMGGSAAPRTPEEGADTAIWLATLKESGPTGGFFRDRKSIAW